MTRLCIWAAALCAASATASIAATVKTTDGLALQFPDGGDLTAMVVDGKPLPSANLTGGFFVSEAGDQGEELIANSSLETDADNDGVPDGFSSGGVWKRDDTVARNGKWSMKAEVPGPEDGMSGSFGITVPVEGGATYMLSFWLKSKDRAGRYVSSIGYLQQFDENGERTTQAFQQNMAGGVSGTSDWTRVATLLTTEGNTRRLYFRTDIYHGTGTLWADDFSVKQVSSTALYLPTQAKAADDTVQMSGADAGRDLAIEAAWKPDGQMLRLEGKISTQAARDRCLRVAYRLPVAAVGGTWGSDVGTAQTIETGGRYSRVASLGQFGPWSVYPFSSVVMPDDGPALSLGAAMAPPRPYRIVYAPDQGLLIEWDLALSQLPEMYPGSADFQAVLYRHDPQWGFRSAAEKYYRLFPDDFKVRVTRFGNWYYIDPSKLDHVEDFGLAYNEMLRPETIAADHALGYLDFGYTEPWGWWGWALGLKPKEEDPKPTYDEMIAILNQRASDTVEAAKPGMNSALVAQSIINSGIYDQDGKLQLRGGYVARWGGYNWSLNPSPYAAEPGKFSRFQATYDWEIEPKLAMGATGIYLDSVVGSWADAPNYRPDHLQRSHHPLTFSALDPVPAQLGVWNEYEFAKHVSEDLHDRDRLLMANIFPSLWVYFNPLLDVMGHETWGANNLEQMRAERTLAYHKPYCWLMQQGDDGPAEDRERWMQAAMLYGIAPNIVGGNSEPARYERWRPLYKKYMPVIIALDEAGWEPVTWARIEPAGALIERFGNRPGQPEKPDTELYLVAHNPTDEPVEVTITPAFRELGIEAPAQVEALPGGDQIAVAAGAFKDTLAAHQTRAYLLAR